MSIGYYPGCSLHGTGRELDQSLRAVVARLGLDLQELDDWSCCGASSAHGRSRLLGAALPARNLALAGEQGRSRVLAPCAACFGRLAAARHHLANDPGLRGEVEKVLERPVPAEVEVEDLVTFLRRALDEAEDAPMAPLGGLPVACYYGCLLLRPAHVTMLDDPEDPSAMEDVARQVGAEPVPWNSRTRCCGAGLSLASTGSVVRLGRAILEDARRAGAAAVVVACPMCHSNLDLRQAAMDLRGGGPIPILYLTELVGLALGIPPEELGLGRHFVSASPILQRLSAGEVA